MKKTKGKIAIVCVILVLSIAAPVFSEGLDMPITDLKNIMDEFTNNLAGSLPFNSTIGLNWSDAYIGNFPRFGVGLSLGLTTMDLGSFGELLDVFAGKVPDTFAPVLPDWVSDFGGFPIPAYAVEARIGGFVLPFDIGVKFGYMPITIDILPKFDYLLIGGDVRFAVLKGNVILPTISVGVGFNYLSGALGMTVGTPRTFSGEVDGTNYTATMKAPEITVDWSTASLDFKAQISKSFLIVTPYLGIGASTGWSKAGVNVKMETETSGNLEDLQKIFEEIGIDIKETGFSSESDPINGWSLRVFGGLTFNITVIRIDLTGFYNFDDKYGITLGARVQL